MSNLVSGQSVKLTADKVQLPLIKGLVVIVQGALKNTGQAFSVLENVEFCTAGTLDLTKVPNDVTKLKLAALSVDKVEVSCGNFTTTLNKTPAKPYWAVAEIYKHNDAWKLRFIDMSIGESTSSASLWAEVDESLLEEKVNFERALGADVTRFAAQAASSNSRQEFTNNAVQTATAIKNDGLALFNRLRGKAKNEAKKFKSKGFLDAAMAVSALVAYADGYASADEEAALISFVQTTSALNAFSSAEVKQSYDAIISELRRSKVIGEGKAYGLIFKFRGKEEAPLLIALAISVADAEGGIDDDEKAVIKKLISSLGEKEDIYQDYL
jgi:tellurite resistance protein TerB